MQDGNEAFTSLDVQRLNIVEKDGTVKMTLFNSDNIPAGIMDGQVVLPGHREGLNISGMIFYNGEGDECGGLVFGSEKKDNGEYESDLSLTFDQYKQDQLVQLAVSEHNGEREYGLNIFDRPDTPLPEFVSLMMDVQKMQDGPEKDKRLETLQGGHRRIFLGKGLNGDVSVRLSDRTGQERIRMVIDEDDTPRIAFLDAHGDVVYSLPPGS